MNLSQIKNYKAYDSDLPKKKLGRSDMLIVNRALKDKLLNVNVSLDLFCLYKKYDFSRTLNCRQI